MNPLPAGENAGLAPHPPNTEQFGGVVRNCPQIMGETSQQGQEELFPCEAVLETCEVWGTTKPGSTIPASLVPRSHRTVARQRTKGGFDGN